MCWIASGAANKIPVNYIKNAYRIKNKHGFGIMWHERGVKTFTTLSYKEFRKKMKSLTDTKIVIHLRYATKGTVDLENCHPFKAGNSAIMHNGTISTLGQYKKYNTPACDSSESDSQGLAALLAGCTYKSIEDIRPLVQHVITDKVNRLVVLNKNGTISYFNKHLGIEEDTIWYSNDYHLQMLPAKVFVYGTLKKGLSNHHLLYSATALGKATTVENYTMIGEGYSFPYVLGKSHLLGIKGHNIEGELYNVNSTTLAALDRLEGYPVHYTKETVAVTTKDGKKTTATIYIKAILHPQDTAATPLKAWYPKYKPYKNKAADDIDKRLLAVPYYFPSDFDKMPAYELTIVCKKMYEAYYGFTPKYQLANATTAKKLLGLITTYLYGA